MRAFLSPKIKAIAIAPPTLIERDTITGSDFNPPSPPLQTNTQQYSSVLLTAKKTQINRHKTNHKQS